MSDLEVRLDHVAYPDAVEELVPEDSQKDLAAVTAPKKALRAIVGCKEYNKDTKAYTKDSHAEIKVKIGDSPFIQHLSLLLLLLAGGKVVLFDTFVRTIKEVLKSDCIVHRSEHTVRVGGPVDHKAQVCDDLHHVHQVPHGLE